MKTEKQIKILTLILIIGLFVSGLTAIPVVSESFALLYFLGDNPWINDLVHQIHKVDQNFPSLFYGLDWLAFAHFVLAFLYVGFYKNPIKNEWLIQFGIIISLTIIPYAFAFGYFREIPVWWRLIDCSFGIIAFAIFYKLKQLTLKLKKEI